MITNFSWLLPGQLAGFGLPEQATFTDLQALRDQGIGALVSLTEAPMDPELTSQIGIRYQHLPVPDMQAPSLDEIQCFTRFVTVARAAGIATATHCRAGLGRTGTMLACYLVHEGHTWDHALATVRVNRPGSVETPAQENVVYEYARMLHAKGQGA